MQGHSISEKAPALQAQEGAAKKPRLGVSIYSYSNTLGNCMTLEDCFEDLHDMGCGSFELLTSHIENYPNPSTKWIDKYWGLCEKYNVQPAELGQWCETHLYRGRMMTDDEIVANMVRDFKLANTLGFKNLRTKLTSVNIFCDPEPGWDRYLEKLLPYAEKYDVRMQSECHIPTTLNRQHISDFIDFIETRQTKHFGINVDFGTFQNAWPDDIFGSIPKEFLWKDKMPVPSLPEDIIRVLPYCQTCHAKFNYMDEDFSERTIPYEPVLQILLEQGWEGDLISEYEGPNKTDPAFVGDQLRRQHVMMRRILGY
ncbi:sugar phosphate isomerase/epimerase [Pseudomonas putida]|uniref:Sugar phosphate isomerase/epimerase n=1 Tax=Pseudomonas putida TaxID=303 RepID=A0A4D6XCL5_PSEPU|nr:TIM barrel protein [Pseudomonas putida]QCI13517.1 sugar phosphate isomerase/epimerase [Pseudomonas putida]